MFAVHTYLLLYVFLLGLGVLTYGAFTTLWLIQRRQLRDLVARGR
jgi:hypothetical protein